MVDVFEEYKNLKSFEVEFFDENGFTIALFAFPGNELEPIN